MPISVSFLSTCRWNLTSAEALSNARAGGKSSVNLDLGPEGKGRLWGTLSNELQLGRKKEGVIERGGYAGMRSKVSRSAAQRSLIAGAVADPIASVYRAGPPCLAQGRGTPRFTTFYACACEVPATACATLSTSKPMVLVS